MKFKYLFEKLLLEILSLDELFSKIDGMTRKEFDYDFF